MHLNYFIILKFHKKIKKEAFKQADSQKCKPVNKLIQFKVARQPRLKVYKKLTFLILISKAF